VRRFGESAPPDSIFILSSSDCTAFARKTADGVCRRRHPAERVL